MPFAKASVAWLLLRIFPGQKLRWFWEAFVAVNAVFFYLNAFLIVFQYQPIAYLWDRSIEGGHCYSPWVVINVGFLAGGSYQNPFSMLVKESTNPTCSDWGAY